MHLWHLQIVVFHHLIKWFAMTGTSIHVDCPIMLHNESSGLREVCLKVADEVNGFCSVVFAATSKEIGKPKLPKADYMISILVLDCITQIDVMICGSEEGSMEQVLTIFTIGSKEGVLNNCCFCLLQPL